MTNQPEISNGPIQRVLLFPKHVANLALGRYRRLGTFGKALFLVWLLVEILLLTFFIVVTPARIFQFLYDESVKLSHTRFGFLALAGLMLLLSFPPLIGYETTVSLCGFAYGWKIGTLIAAVASILGSAIVFLLLRFLFSYRLRKWSRNNEKFTALDAVVREKGLPLIILIRVSPIPPWVYSNALFASIESVTLWQFVIATMFTCPNILLHAFIASRMAALSDGNQRQEMDTNTKILNGFLVGGGIVIGMVASWSVYTLVQKHIRNLRGIPPVVDGLAADAIEDFDEEAPLLGSSQERRL